MPHALLDGLPADRIAAMAELAGRTDEPDAVELDALGECLGDPAKRIQRRAAEVFAALAVRGVAVGDRLHAALGAAELRQRWGATYALSLIGAVPLAALPTLLELLGSDDGDLRWAAAQLVERLASVDRATVSARLLGAARAPGAQRKMALYCLRDLDVEEGCDAALAALTDEHIETRLAALSFVAQVHRDRAAAARQIAALLVDGDPRMQRAAAGTLGSVGVSSEEVLQALHRAAASTDSSLARAATHSLRLLTAM
jgi:hypothetical protein